MEDKIIRAVIGSQTPMTDLLHKIIEASAIAESKLSKEEKTERDKAWQESLDERIRKKNILKNICPDCEGKLIRGKKDKRNDYKRSWTCEECGNSHSL